LERVHLTKCQHINTFIPSNRSVGHIYFVDKRSSYETYGTGGCCEYHTRLCISFQKWSRYLRHPFQTIAKLQHISLTKLKRCCNLLDLNVKR